MPISLHFPERRMEAIVDFLALSRSSSPEALGYDCLSGQFFLKIIVPVLVTVRSKAPVTYGSL